MASLRYTDLFKNNMDTIFDWYIQRGTPDKSIQNIKNDIENTINTISQNPYIYRVLQSRPYLHFATTPKYKFHIYYISNPDYIIFHDIKAPRQNGLYEAYEEEINEILRLAGVKTA